MAAPGRKRVPTALRVLRGNPRQHAIPANEPKPEVGIPTRPKWLAPEARREWRRVAGQLEDLGILTIVDRAALAAYCQAWARAVAAEKVIAKDGETFTTPNGYIQQRPEVSIAQKQWQLVAKFAAEFGLTPSSRSRISVPEAKRPDGFEEYLEIMFDRRSD